MERLNRSFVAEPQAVPAARDALGALDGLIDEGTREDLRLLVSEILANAVVHGSRRPTDSIAMRVSIAPAGIHVEVRDRGPGFAREPRGHGGELRAEGWGLFLLDRLADRWGVRSSTDNEVWFELDSAAQARRAGTSERRMAGKRPRPPDRPWPESTVATDSRSGPIPQPT